MSSEATAPTPAPPATIPMSTIPMSKTKDSTSDLPAIIKNNPARTGFDPQTSTWVNYFKILTGSMTPEGQFHFRESRSQIYEDRDCKRCDEYRDWALQHSPTVRFLREKIEMLNGNLDSSNVVCRRCPARLTEDGEVHRQSGGFSPAHGILLCANEVRSRDHLEDTLAHEMVHAWDHLRYKVDWMGEKVLEHAACTEIRASMLSGECRWARESFTRGNWKLTQQFQDCVRARAVQSLLARPKCKDDVQAVKVVNKVWDSCFSDTRPFDEVYR